MSNVLQDVYWQCVSSGRRPPVLSVRRSHSPDPSPENFFGGPRGVQLHLRLSCRHRDVVAGEGRRKLRYDHSVGCDIGNVSITHHKFAVTDVSGLGVSDPSANSTGSAACLGSHFRGLSSCDGGLLLLPRVDHQLWHWRVICAARIRGFRPVERWQETVTERHVSTFRTLAGDCV